MSTQKQPLPGRSIGYATAAVAAGWLWLDLLPTDTPGRGLGWWLLAGGLTVVAVATWHYLGRLRGSSATLGRWSRRADRHDGMASAWQLWRVASAHTMRRRATVLRPGLAHVGWWRRRRTPTTQYATRLARVGWQGVWSPVEDVTLRLGGPRTGKTGELACRILDAPGAVLATSTRSDLITLTGTLRGRRGPVHVFNPSGLGQLASTVKFSPLIGCRNPRTAADRAADLVGATSSGPGSGDREWWAGQARDVLTVLLHAAALADHTMHTIAHWIADATSAQSPVLRALDRSPQPEVFREAARGFFTTNERTQTSITASIRPALAWLTDATAAASAEGTDEAMLDVEQFLAQAGTLYLLGAEDAIVAPLVTALTAEIARTARRIASDHGGRLDPPLTLALDEAALICPVPLDRWTADMGGRNVTIHIGAQSRAQLRQRWGDTGAAAIVNNSSTILVFGGMRDPDDLRAFEALSGEREDITYTRDRDGQVTGSTTKRVPVLTAAQLANLPARRVMVVRRGVPASIGRVQMAWQRRPVRRALRHQPAAAAAPPRQNNHDQPAWPDRAAAGDPESSSAQPEPARVVEGVPR